MVALIQNVFIISSQNTPFYLL